VNARKPIPPDPEVIGERILHNLDRVRHFLNILQAELKDPARSGKIGSPSTWQSNAAKMDQELVTLRKLIEDTEFGQQK